MLQPVRGIASSPMFMTLGPALLLAVGGEGQGREGGYLSLVWATVQQTRGRAGCPDSRASSSTCSRWEGMRVEEGIFFSPILPHDRYLSGQLSHTHTLGSSSPTPLSPVSTLLCCQVRFRACSPECYSREGQSHLLLSLFCWGQLSYQPQVSRAKVLASPRMMLGNKRQCQFSHTHALGACSTSSFWTSSAMLPR